MSLEDQRENFEKAFVTGTSGCRRTCKCGREFYEPDGGWDWEDGELDALEADENSTALDWSAGTIAFGGEEYAIDCDCWHTKRDEMIRAINRDAHGIAKFLLLEKARKQREADKSPIVA